MPIRVTAYLGDGTLRRRDFDRGDYRIGRSPDADFSIPDPRISREHLRLVGGDKGWRVEDLASKNGVLVDGRPVAAAAISRAAWLSLGGAPVRLEPVMAGAEAARRRAGGEFVRQLKTAKAPAALFDSVLDALVAIGGCERASLWSARGGGDPVLVRRRGPATPRESLTVMRRALDQGKPVLTHDVAGAEALAHCQSLIDGGVRALICLPLVIDGAARGVLYADCREVGKAFSDLDLDLLENVADQAAISLAAVSLHDAIEGVSALR